MSRSTEQEQERDARRSLLKLWGISLLATAILFGLALKLMGPAPPQHLVLASGPADGVYHEYAEAYRAELAKEGIEVEVRTTVGSIENLRLLESGDVDVGFVQGGTANAAQREALRSVASVFLEPLWIFHRKAANVRGLAGLRSLRIAVGPEGSGTRSLAVRLLEVTGALTEDGEGDPATVTALWGSAATQALLAGEVDAAFFVVATEAPWIRDLLASDDLGLLALERQEALVRRHRFLDRVEVPRGLLDLTRDVPSRDLHLLAPTAALVGRAEQHPAIAPLFIEAARRVHGAGGLLAEPGRFPSSRHLDIPVSDDARRYFEQGPSWLYRVFPFRLASFFDRAIFLLLPLLTLLIPLLKTAPPLYRWGVRRRIYRWYRGVRDADRALTANVSEAELRTHLDGLQKIEHEVGRVSIPLSYMQEFYNLRLHLDFVTERLDERLGSGGQEATEGTTRSE